MGWIRVAAALLPALVLTGAAPEPASTGHSRPIVELPRPRELSEAERAAVELAAAYFQAGSEAWWDSLAAGAPLRRLGRAAALEEIGVRAGPVDGATWQLLTPGPKLEPQTAVFGVELASGLDETLVLHLVDEGGWKIAGLRVSVDPVAPVPPGSAALPAAKRSASRRASSSVPAAPAGSSAGSPTAWRIALALFVLSLTGAAGTLLLARAGKRWPALGAGAATVVAGAGVGLWIWMAAPSPAAPAAARPAPKPAVVESGVLRLGSLLPLRRALAEGTDRAEIERRLATPPADSGLREIQELWRAQYLLLGTAQVKLSVKSIIQRYRGGAGIDVVPACTELSTDVPRLLDTPALWASPDPDVKAALRNAYQTLGNLGTACLAGRENEIRFLIIEAERALAEAARVLEPYSLAP